MEVENGSNETTVIHGETFYIYILQIQIVLAKLCI